ncbi:MAG: helix-turn-helix domain-containing protein [Chloroflexi bacterium]|nr:helix-turn-helix domain-containing protein [Chloroflexota bacterium]
MWTLGETLRQARLDKGVSLADAARDTRIRRSYLEALEGEDLATLPPPVYTRGFLRTYAEYLGLNAQAMVDLYQPSARREPTPTLRPAVAHVPLPRSIPVRPVLYGLGGIAFLLLFGFAWNWYQDVQHTLNQSDAALRQQARFGTPTPIGARLPTSIPVLLPTPTPTLQPTPEPTATPTAVIDGILVEFRTSARVYVEAAVDGKQVVAETVAAGTDRQLPLAQSTVIMRASNGSAVDVTVNGTHQDPQTVTNPVELSWRR